MMNFFEMHSEQKIGYKKLSDADLGTSLKSHQTHIGLAGSVLTFLSDRDVIGEDSIFIYDNKFEYIDAYFDRIENPDGTFRSPKIRTGERGCISVVSTIRDIVKREDTDLNWSLIWFGLKNEKIVFFLFNNRSDDYKFFCSHGMSFNSTGTKSISSTNSNFPDLLKYIEKRINSAGEYVLKDLEVSSQTGSIIPNKKYKAYDINKAMESFIKTGRKGEELINSYFNKQVEKKQILSFVWYNESRESGLPYDFSIQTIDNDIIYLDVKSTTFGFDQQMIFSSQEMNYIYNTHNAYCIYRVYKKDLDNYYLRICSDCKKLSTDICNSTKLYEDNLKSLDVKFKGAKIAISPKNLMLSFKSEIPIS